jgi:hypothetical protein
MKKPKEKVVDKKIELCPICHKEPAWVVWGKATPCGDCVPIKIHAGLDEPYGRWSK